MLISGVQRQPIPSVSSNCDNLVLTIEQAGEPTLPRSLFVKLPMESLLTRWFFSIINAWRLESHFFRHVAHTLPLRTPLTYATRCQGTRFYLVQENLHEDPGVELFTNPDMLIGPSLELVHRCLDTFARLHACHYGLGAQEREKILPLRYHLFLSPGMGPVSRMLNRLALQAVHEEAARRDTQRGGAGLPAAPSKTGMPCCSTGLPARCRCCTATATWAIFLCPGRRWACWTGRPPTGARAFATCSTS